MKRIYVATKTRGFLSNLFTHNIDGIEFYYDENNVYEVNSRVKILMSKMARSSFADYLGLIQRVKVKENVADMLFSYNRFLKSKTDYIIYLENPLALVHYSTTRPTTQLGKLRLKKFLGDTYLKGIVCLSKACYNTLTNFYDIPPSIIVDQIYPFIPNRDTLNIDSIIKKCNDEDLYCLYISSDFKLKGGEDIIEAFDKLIEDGVSNVKLNIITCVDKLDNNLINKIKSNPNIQLNDFKFNMIELNEIYEKSNILLNPTRQDSFPLVVLEAMKSGNVIITTDIYALTEMVEDNYNGFLTEPKYRFFNKNNMPNESVWNNRKETIYSNYIDYNVVEFIYEKICYLNENRDILGKMSINSFEKASKNEFGEEYIIDKWRNILL